jgi:Fe-S cluster biogenesis protein NfuA
MAARNLREVGDRVEELLTQLRGADDPALTERAEELVRLLMELYGAGLERVMELVTKGADPTLVGRIADDQLLASLLVLHGLHPVPVETRILQALDKAEKYAGPVRYLGIDDQGVAHLELENPPQGCPSTAMTVKDAIEKAVTDAAPELGGVELAGVFAPPPTPTGNGTPVSIGTKSNAVPVTIGRAPR